MTCDDVQRLLHPFVDTELPPPMLLAVARHAGSCASCDSAIRELTELRDALVASSDSALEALDLSGIWPAVVGAIETQDRRAHRIRRLRALPLWGSVAALAASMLIAYGIVGVPHLRSRGAVVAEQPVATGPVARVAARGPVLQAPLPVGFKYRSDALPNRAAFDRLWGKGIEVRREPKSGTTVVLVSDVGSSGE